MLNEKLCKLCGEVRPTADWWKSSTTKDGLQANCRYCQRDMQRKRLQDKDNALAKQEQHLAWRARSPDKWKRNWRRSLLKVKFDMTEQQYEELLVKQQYVCAICSKPDKQYLAVDHNHSTGGIRGLLCSRCNLGLGHFFDDTELLSSALSYLEQHNKKGP